MNADAITGWDYWIHLAGKDAELPHEVKGWDGDCWVWRWTEAAERATYQVSLRLREGDAAHSKSELVVDAAAWDALRKHSWSQQRLMIPVPPLPPSKDSDGPLHPLARTLQEAWKAARQSADELQALPADRHNGDDDLREAFRSARARKGA